MWSRSQRNSQPSPQMSTRQLAASGNVDAIMDTDYDEMEEIINQILDNQNQVGCNERCDDTNRLNCKKKKMKCIYDKIVSKFSLNGKYPARIALNIILSPAFQKFIHQQMATYSANVLKKTLTKFSSPEFAGNIDKHVGDFKQILLDLNAEIENDPDAAFGNSKRKQKVTCKKAVKKSTVKKPTLKRQRSVKTATAKHSPKQKATPKRQRSVKTAKQKATPKRQRSVKTATVKHSPKQKIRKQPSRNAKTRCT